MHMHVSSRTSKLTILFESLAPGCGFLPHVSELYNLYYVMEIYQLLESSFFFTSNYLPNE